MKGPQTLLSRFVALASATAITTAAVIAFGATPAQAAPLGTIALNPTSGTVDANPMLVGGTSSAKCPAEYGQNAVLRVGPIGGPYNNLNRIGSDGNYDQAPFTLATNRSMTAALGAPPANGDYEIVIECSGVILGTHPDKFVTVITVNGSNWAVKGSSNPTATTTTLTASPAGSAQAGSPVTLTAAVSPAAAAGNVEFRRGATAIGTAPVASGSAALTVSNLPVGSHELTVVFSPTDSTAYAGSASAAAPYQITAPPGSISADQELSSTVAPGAFSLGLAGNSATLTGGVVGGSATGDLNAATVTDLRGTNGGWNLVGQVEDFTSGANRIAADNLGWTPSASKVDASGNVIPGGAANPGAGTGLGSARTLCKAENGSSSGVFRCGAQLTLNVPDTTAPGSYAATLTLTLA